MAPIATAPIAITSHPHPGRPVLLDCSWVVVAGGVSWTVVVWLTTDGVVAVAVTVLATVTVSVIAGAVTVSVSVIAGTAVVVVAVIAAEAVTPPPAASAATASAAISRGSGTVARDRTD